MSHLGQLKAILTEAGVEFEIDESGSRTEVLRFADLADRAGKERLFDPPAASTLLVRSKLTDEGRNIGYGGFFSELGFDSEGSLVWWGAWGI
jgi:hypothetical protein